MRIEPPPSVPSASGAMPSATRRRAAARGAAGRRLGSHGLRGDAGAAALSVTPFQPSSGVVVLPTSTRALLAQPGHRRARRRPTGPAASIVCEPRSVGQPRVSSRSLIDTGTPSSTPARLAAGPPRFGRAGGRERRGLVDEAERVDPRVEPGDAGEHRAGGLHRRQRAGPVGGEQFDGLEVGGVGHAGVMLRLRPDSPRARTASWSAMRRSAVAAGRVRVGQHDRRARVAALAQPRVQRDLARAAAPGAPSDARQRVGHGLPAAGAEHLHPGAVGQLQPRHVLDDADDPLVGLQRDRARPARPPRPRPAAGW